MPIRIDIHPEVKKALESDQGVVALESTIISHGMPYPDNLTMAEKVEAIVRENGSVPATIAVLNGVVKIGLNPEELKTLATHEDVMKVSRRDIPYLLANRAHGATTVSGTMIFAQMAGIKVFATGGIGGVHRGAEETFDISRDLEELADIDMAVVCAGAKSILDLPKTLEYLETKGVPVLGYGTKELPAFYTRESGLSVDYEVKTPDMVATMMKAKFESGLKGGMVVANPIPEKDSLSKAYIDNIIAAALALAEKKGIAGKAITPFLLSEIKDRTDGKSLEANLALVYNNAKVAALIAAAYANQQ